MQMKGSLKYFKRDQSPRTAQGFLQLILAKCVVFTNLFFVNTKIFRLSLCNYKSHKLTVMLLPKGLSDKLCTICEEHFVLILCIRKIQMP